MPSIYSRDVQSERLNSLPAPSPGEPAASLDTPNEANIKLRETKKFDYIDILRAVAILGVLGVHAHQQINNLSEMTNAVFNYGQLGVQLFFIASALTLCLSASERRESGTINFYLRRFFRIAPLYYFGIALYSLWYCAMNLLRGHPVMPASYSASAVLENIFFVHGFDPKNFNFIVPGGWSIAAEMAFYAIFPVLFWLLNTLRLRIFIMLTLAVALLSLLGQYLIMTMAQAALMTSLHMSSAVTNDEFGFIYALILNQINVFMIGLIAFKCLSMNVSKTLLAFGAALVVVSMFLQNNHSYDTGYDGFIYPILSALAFSIFAIKFSQVKFRYVLFTKMLQKIGQNSFSIYIMHFVVLDMLRLVFNHTIFKAISSGELKVALIFPPLVFLTYLVATQTNKYIEKPGIKFGKRFLR